MTSAHHNHRQPRLPAAQPRAKMSTWPVKPETSRKTTASQIRALLWHAFLRSAFSSRPCNCGLYDWLMQTWQVQNTVLKPKYWLLMLLGIHLEYKTAHCTLKMAWTEIRRSRSSWHTVNTSFSVLFQRNVLCLSRSPDNHSGHNNCLTVTVSYGITYPVFSGVVTPCHAKQVPDPAPVSIWQASFHSEPIFFFQGLRGRDSRLGLCFCSAEAWYWSV